MKGSVIPVIGNKAVLTIMLTKACTEIQVVIPPESSMENLFGARLVIWKPLYAITAYKRTKAAVRKKPSSSAEAAKIKSSTA